MNEPETATLDQLAYFIATMLKEHYPDHASALESSLFDVEDLAAELSEVVLSRIKEWERARETVAVTLAECVLLMLPRLHPALCKNRRRADHCNADVSFCASVLLLLAAWQLKTPFLAAPAPLVGDALTSQERGIRRDRLEVAFRAVLAPRSVARELWTVRPGCLNLQVNTAVTRPNNVAYEARRALARHIKFALDSPSMSVEVTAEWAHPADACRPPLDDAVDGAIHRTTAMVLFADDGGIGTGDTLRLAGDLSIPTLVLRSLENESSPPLQARREGRLALRIERFYNDETDVLHLVNSFLADYQVQIERRHADLVTWAARAEEIRWISDAVMALDPAIFETANITQESALFLTSDPLYWFQARPAARKELQRLVAHEQPRSEPRPIPTDTLGAPSVHDDAENSRSVIRAVRAERSSTVSLMTAAEIHGWTFAVVSRLMAEHERREARQTKTTSHMIPPMQQRDWERLHLEVYGP